MTRNPWKPLILTKEWMVAFFLPTYLIFPVLNSLEFAIFFTQGSSFCFVVFLIFGLRAGFWISSNFYDRVVDFAFGNVLAIYFKGFHRCLPLLERFSRLVGVFYGFCLLSSFVRFEFPDQVWVYVISGILYTVRNILIIPFIGVNLLSFWLINETSKLEGIQEIPRDTCRVIQQGMSFENYDSHYFRYHPLVLGKKHRFSLETRRGLFQVIMQKVIPLATRETIKWTVGTTAGGSLVLAGFSYGREKDRYIEETYKKTTQACHHVISNSTSQEEKDLAFKIMEAANNHLDVYLKQAGGTIVIRGLKTIVDAKIIVESTDAISDQYRRSNALRAASQMSKESREPYLRKAAGETAVVSTPTGKGVASPSEPEMVSSLLEIVKF